MLLLATLLSILGCRSKSTRKFFLPIVDLPANEAVREIFKHISNGQKGTTTTTMMMTENNASSLSQSPSSSSSSPPTSSPLSPSMETGVVLLISYPPPSSWDEAFGGEVFPGKMASEALFAFLDEVSRCLRLTTLTKTGAQVKRKSQTFRCCVSRNLHLHRCYCFF